MIALDASALLAFLLRERGHRLGDRACLALARERRIPALTADRAWRRLDLEIEIETIR
jgi:PIN domain nuclease of toxin-antitoxin system